MNDHIRITYVFEVSEGVVIDDRNRSLNHDDSSAYSPELGLVGLESATKEDGPPCGDEGLSIRMLGCDIAWLELLW